MRPLIFRILYWIFWTPLLLVSELLCIFFRDRFVRGSVLHISYPVHIAHQTVELLKKAGVRADYLAVGGGTHWLKWDYRYEFSRFPIFAVLRDFILFWKLVSRYEIIHSHFMITPSPIAWEFRMLKRLGRGIIIHYRGCEIRDWQKNMALHPKVNICQNCDYGRTICTNSYTLERQKISRRYGDRFLVTTPDMKDFVPTAEHIPFFAPEVTPSLNKKPSTYETPLRIVHVTNHPGIEGTEEIRNTIETLKAKGYSIDFVFLRDVSYEQVMEEYATADLSIGKMKMGYYANAQIESMASGVPTITWVRPEFMTEELKKSGLIFSDLTNLEKTIEYYLKHPQELKKRRVKVREGILEVHKNSRIIERLNEIYREIS